ncbi:MAG: adenosylcobalamin-dependent ribonucleoside-diphosphate reductase [Firmicutes bacterium]|nr:adenosylcobalamin-dependent ribonucleoside-diphosphate reductase [Bacillota bacterium]
MKLSKNARIVLERRYLRKDESGRPVETPEDLFRRVATVIAEVDRQYGASDAQAARRAEEFYRLLDELEFVPNSPTLMNAGRPLGQLSACFVLPVGDSMEEIFDSLKHAALIHKSGGGTGFSFSRLRPKDDLVSSTGGVASGPVSFMKVFNAATEAVKQGGCVVPSTRVLTSHGLIPLGELGPEAGKGEDGAWYAPRGGVLQVATDQGWHPADEFYQHGHGRVRKIRTRSGFSLQATLRHRLRVVDAQGQYRWRRVGDLQPGDWLALQAGAYPQQTDYVWPSLEKNDADGTGAASPGVQAWWARPALQLFTVEEKDGCVALAGCTAAGSGAGMVDLWDGPSAAGTLSGAAARRGEEGAAGPGSSWAGGPTLAQAQAPLQDDCERAWQQAYAMGRDLAQQALEAGGAGVRPLRWPEAGFRAERRLVEAMVCGFWHYAGRRTDGGQSIVVLAQTQQSLLEDLQQVLLALGQPAALAVTPGSRSGRSYAVLALLPEGSADFLPAPAAAAGEKPLSGAALPGDGLGAKGGTAAPLFCWSQVGLERWWEEWWATVSAPCPYAGPGCPPGQFYDPVVEIQEGLAFTVDLSVPGIHTYLANGFVSHNTRRGANMGILRVDHPDILEFITCKADNREITNFNISVALTQAFMEAYQKDQEYDLVNPRTHQVVKRLRARDVFEKIVEMAWKNGEPGIIFLDRINAANPTPALGEIESTNPCGEQPLLPYEACNLGSINLALMVRPAKRTDGPALEIDWDRLERVVRSSVRFLDNVVDASQFPLAQITEMARGNRKIGLGVMGFADLLIQLGIPYDSEEAVDTAAQLMSFIQRVAKETSAQLGEERGPFPNFDKSIYAPNGPRYRNATVTTVAPTGTISIIAGVSSGIEPLFALAFERHVMDDDRLVEVNPLFEQVARQRGFYSEALMRQIAAHGSARGVKGVPEDVQRIFATAHDIAPEWHIRIQAAFQKYTDNAVSKTVNFRHEATPEDVRRVYLLAYELGCKGVTVYRDGSRESQVLTVGKSQEAGKAVAAGKTPAVGGEAVGTAKRGAAEAAARGGAAPDASESRPAGKASGSPSSGQEQSEVTPVNGQWGNIRPIERPRRLVGVTDMRETPLGNLYLTLNVMGPEQHPFELFAQIGKAGSDVTAFTEAMARLISLAFRCGIDPAEVAHQLVGIGASRSVGFGPYRVRSVPDAIGQFLLEFLENQKEGKAMAMLLPPGVAQASLFPEPGKPGDGGQDRPGMNLCPVCGNQTLVYAEGCSKCLACGHSEC